jgi:hypothetical protein
MLRSYLLSIFLLCAAGLAQAQPILPQEQAAVRHGFYAGAQFGYLDNDYGDNISLYVPSAKEVTPQGSRFAFTANAGYNYNRWFGGELGGLFFSDGGQSQASDPLESASVRVDTVNMLGLIHLKLDDSYAWVATIKPGIALMFAQFDYRFQSSRHNPPWGTRVAAKANLKKTVLVPTIGISFQHSYNRHWAMNFSYQYYYADYATFNDPYKTPVSSLAYMNVGGSYSF